MFIFLIVCHGYLPINFNSWDLSSDFHEFRTLLSKQASVECYTEWVDTMVDRCVLKVSIDHMPYCACAALYIRITFPPCLRAFDKRPCVKWSAGSAGFTHTCMLEIYIGGGAD